MKAERGSQSFHSRKTPKRLSSLVGLRQAPFAIPKGALIIGSEWSLQGGTPKGFTKEIKAGLPRAELEDGSIKLSSAKSSFGFKKEVTASVRDYPYLHWSWQARMLPRGGEFRKRETDDQAGQLYMLFPRSPGKLNIRMLGYLWENEALKGTSGNEHRLVKTQMYQGAKSVPQIEDMHF